MTVHRTGGRHTFSLAAPRYYRRRLRAEPFDVVVEDLNKVPLFTPTWTEAPVALLVHHLFGGTAFQEASFAVAAATCLLELPVPRAFAGRPTVAVSHSTRDDLVRRGMDGDAIEVIPNGVDLETLAPVPELGRFDEPTVLYLGRLKRYKRVDLVVRAVAALQRSGRGPSGCWWRGRAITSTRCASSWRSWASGTRSTSSASWTMRASWSCSGEAGCTS